MKIVHMINWFKCNDVAQTILKINHDDNHTRAITTNITQSVTMLTEKSKFDSNNACKNEHDQTTTMLTNLQCFAMMFTNSTSGDGLPTANATHDCNKQHESQNVIAKEECRS